jgi:PhoPQ-activated pathogenicity-related protein
MENDPKKFWSLINKLSNTSSGVVSDNVPHKELVQHFKNLNLNQFQQHIVKILNELINKLETDNRVNKLNDKIKHEEIIKAIRK